MASSSDNCTHKIYIVVIIIVTHFFLILCLVSCSVLAVMGTVFQYDDSVEGSVLTVSCMEGYVLPEGDMEFVCTSDGSWSPDPLDYVCIPSEGKV